VNADPQVVDAAVGHRLLAVDVDRLDAVAFGVEQEGAVVGRAVLRARAGRAVVAVPRVNLGLPERVDLPAVVCTEADVGPAVTGCSCSIDGALSSDGRALMGLSNRGIGV
jgi:hypothetical protein